MNKVFISRSDSNDAWGFRLQGGLEYREPLTITNIVPNSPVDGKISPGDMLIEIAGVNVTQMSHKDALELIQRCGNALFLTIQKAGHSNPSDAKQTWEYTTEQSYNYDNSSTPSSLSWYNSSLINAGNIPQAPIYDPNFISNATKPLLSRQSSTDMYPSYEQSQEASAIIARFLSRPGGPKPFTYTPGGLDLSKIIETSRAKRHRERRSVSEDNQPINPTMNRRMVVPSEHLNQHHYTNNNPIQPFSYARQKPTPPKKNIEHDTDVITQSRSFQMLQGWISDSEKTIPNILSSSMTQYSTYRSPDAQNGFDQRSNTDRRRSSSGGATTLPSRSFRYLQEQYRTNDDDYNNTPVGNRTIEKTTISSSSDGNGLRRSSDAHHPSRAFKYLHDQYATNPEVSSNQTRTVNNRNDLMEIYNKTPASFREREPEAPRYTGSTVPSRSFRFLQMMTKDDDEQNDTKFHTKPQQSLLNKYDEHNYLPNKNRLNEHPSRSFKYLQEITGEQRSAQTSTLTNALNSTHIGASDF